MVVVDSAERIFGGQWDEDQELAGGEGRLGVRDAR